MSGTVLLTVKIIAVFAASYLLGSIQPSYILGKRLKHVDIRDFGSGNSGATNAIRVFGIRFGISCLLIDAAKGAVAILIAKYVFGPSVVEPSISLILQLLSGLCVILGHNHPFYMDFQGGKGIAASIGVLLTIDYRLLFYAGIPAIIILIVFRYMSVASLSFEFLSFVAITALNFKSGHFYWIAITAALFPIIAFYRHKANIKRLANGTEPKLWTKKSDLKNDSGKEDYEKAVENLEEVEKKEEPEEPEDTSEKNE